MNNTFIVKVVSMVLVILVIMLVGSMNLGLTTETFADAGIPTVYTGPVPTVPPAVPSDPTPSDPVPSIPPNPVPAVPSEPVPSIPPKPVPSDPVPAEPINVPKRPKWFDFSIQPEGKPRGVMLPTYNPIPKK